MDIALWLLQVLLAVSAWWVTGASSEPPTADKIVWTRGPPTQRVDNAGPPAATSPRKDKSFFRHVGNPKADSYEFEYQQTMENQSTSRMQDVKGGAFKVKVVWQDKGGNSGEHQWEYQHVNKDPGVQGAGKLPPPDQQYASTGHGGGGSAQLSGETSPHFGPHYNSPVSTGGSTGQSGHFEGGFLNNNAGIEPLYGLAPENNYRTPTLIGNSGVVSQNSEQNSGKHSKGPSEFGFPQRQNDQHHNRNENNVEPLKPNGGDFHHSQVNPLEDARGRYPVEIPPRNHNGNFVVSLLKRPVDLEVKLDNLVSTTFGETYGVPSDPMSRGRNYTHAHNPSAVTFARIPPVYGTPAPQHFDKEVALFPPGRENISLRKPPFLNGGVSPVNPPHGADNTNDPDTSKPIAFPGFAGNYGDTRVRPGEVFENQHATSGSQRAPFQPEQNGGVNPHSTGTHEEKPSSHRTPLHPEQNGSPGVLQSTPNRLNPHHTGPHGSFPSQGGFPQGPTNGYIPAEVGGHALNTGSGHSNQGKQQQGTLAQQQHRPTEHNDIPQQHGPVVHNPHQQHGPALHSIPQQQGPLVDTGHQQHRPAVHNDIPQQHGPVVHNPHQQHGPALHNDIPQQHGPAVHTSHQQHGLSLHNDIPKHQRPLVHTSNQQHGPAVHNDIPQQHGSLVHNDNPLQHGTLGPNNRPQQHGPLIHTNHQQHGPAMQNDNHQQHRPVVHNIPQQHGTLGHTGHQQHGPAVHNANPQQQRPVVHNDIAQQHGPLVHNDVTQQHGTLVHNNSPQQHGPLVHTGHQQYGPPVHNANPQQHRPVVHNDISQQNGQLVHNNSPKQHGQLVHSGNQQHRPVMHADSSEEHGSAIQADLQPQRPLEHNGSPHRINVQPNIGNNQHTSFQDSHENYLAANVQNVIRFGNTQENSATNTGTFDKPGSRPSSGTAHQSVDINNAGNNIGNANLLPRPIRYDTQGTFNGGKHNSGVSLANLNAGEHFNNHLQNSVGNLVNSFKTSGENHQLKSPPQFGDSNRRPTQQNKAQNGVHSLGDVNDFNQNFGGNSVTSYDTNNQIKSLGDYNRPRTQQGIAANVANSLGSFNTKNQNSEGNLNDGNHQSVVNIHNNIQNSPSNHRNRYENHINLQTVQKGNSNQNTGAKLINSHVGGNSNNKHPTSAKNSGGSLPDSEAGYKYHHPKEVWDFEKDSEGANSNRNFNPKEKKKSNVNSSNPHSNSVGNFNNKHQDALNANKNLQDVIATILNNVNQNSDISASSSTSKGGDSRYVEINRTPPPASHDVIDSENTADNPIAIAELEDIITRLLEPRPL